MILGELGNGQIWCILVVLNFSPLTYSGEVTKLTWPKVTDIKKRNIQIVDTYVLIVHCEFQRVRITGVPLAECQTSKNVTWGQGGVTFGVIGSSCFWKCVKLLSEQLWQIWRRVGRFFAICEKPEGADNRPPPPPPAVRGIEESATVSNRGVTFDRSLTFSSHIAKMKTRCNGLLVALSPIRQSPEWARRHGRGESDHFDSSS